MLTTLPTTESSDNMILAVHDNSSTGGWTLALEPWHAVLSSVVLSLIFLTTIVGNILVIMSVFTYRPLRNVQNFLIVSLAVADLLVSVTVMPLNIVTYVTGQWQFGPYLCDFWLTCDIFFCTASILNLCAIALDRYWAIRCPISYSNRRTLNMVLFMIFLVYSVSALISIPPLFGWKKQPKSPTICVLSDEKSYVVFSAMGSFFIPAMIMSVVYLNIFLAVKNRLKQRREKSALTAMIKMKKESPPDIPIIQESNGSPRNVEDNEACHVDCPHFDCKSPTSRTINFKPSDLNPTCETIQLPLVTYGHSSECCPSPTTNNNQLEVMKNEVINSSSRFNQNSSSNNNSDETPQETPSIRRKLTDHDKETMSRSTNKTSTTKSNEISGNFHDRQKISLSRERRATRTLGIIMGVFVLCWVPFFIMYVTLPFCGDSCYLDSRAEALIVWLGYVNSCLNPLIYTIFNMDFRKAFQKILKIKQSGYDN